MIAAHQITNSYLALRFEDIFGKDAVDPVFELNRLRIFLGCGEMGENEQKEWLKISANKSRKDLSGKWPVQDKHLDFLMEKGEDVLRKFNYTIDDQKDDREEMV